MSNEAARLKESRFDFTHDSQRIFRILMSALASPGTPHVLPDLQLAGATRETRFVILPLLTLLDMETTFCVQGGCAEECEEITRYLELNTGAKRAWHSQADFILCLSPVLSEKFAQLKGGTLEAPHKSATVIYLVNDLSPVSNDGAFKLVLSGPGIDTERCIHISGVSLQEVTEWEARRFSFPLGVDLFLISRKGGIIGLPRSTNIRH